MCKLYLRLIIELDCCNVYQMNNAVTINQAIGDAREENGAGVMNGNVIAQPSKQQQRRVVVLEKPTHEGLGMSITVSYKVRVRTRE